MNIMFMGTPDFAIASLEALYNAGHNVVSVVTREDKPRGRGHKIMHTPVYECAKKHDTIIYQPENLKKENFEKILVENNPDLIAVVAYGKILPEYIINYPKYGCVNVHASLLPKYRGAAPMQHSIINGETETGVTTMLMDKGLDTGDMLLKEKIEIGPEDNLEIIHDKLSVIGAKLLIETINLLKDGKATREKQNDDESCYSPMIDKETAKIDWTKDAATVKNLVRGLYPFPRAFTLYNGKILKIEHCQCESSKYSAPCGTVVSKNNKSFTVQCGFDTCLVIDRIQLEGKKSMLVEDFFLGNTIECDTILGY